MRWTALEAGSSAVPLHPRAAQPPWRRLLPVALAGLAIAAVLLALQLIRLDVNDKGSGPTAPFIVGNAWGLDEELAARHVRATVSDGTGYDGQWFLGLAYDPLLRGHLADGFDMPRYRARRPLFAMAGWVLAAGRPAAIPVALLAVELLAVGLGCAAVGRVLARYGRSTWWGLGFALIPGVVVGVMFGTAEPLGLALAALGLSLVLDGRLAAAGLAVAGAALTKETFLVFGAAAAAYLLLRSDGPPRRRLRAALTVSAPGAVLLALWWWYVARMVPPSPTDDTGVQAFSQPLLGWPHVLARIARGAYVPDAPVGVLGPALLAATFLLLLAAVVSSLRPRTLAAWTGLLLGCYGLALDGDLLDRFLSASRALAPCVLGAGLALLAAGLPWLRARDAAEPAA
jgi:hypothetical protein